MQWGDIISKKVFLHAFALQFSYEYIVKRHLHRNKNPPSKKFEPIVYGSKVLEIIFSKLKNPEGTAHSKRHFTLALSDHDSLLNVLIGPTQTCMHTKHY